ncbi:hypothetical protein BU26DRAFT_601514 [Trematosphaeria pertusa]|uniref:Uncharacterized protein n=1 Tax=Trematosphaeria pertusa TaxID=390896 RepID=A0A6A6IS53_9PLEO|nr:uncharacterized protein BU26DRAFT_601514 [Trematosphaeria pertusa]KAF2253375.1 hypothetical protein BU26DRAFT_601514 [Trematosphaeria pertusa]
MSPLLLHVLATLFIVLLLTLTSAGLAYALGLFDVLHRGPAKRRVLSPSTTTGSIELKSELKQKARSRRRGEYELRRDIDEVRKSSGFYRELGERYEEMGQEIVGGIRRA